MHLPADFAPIRIGVAGLGRTGMYHVERIGLRDDCRLVALYDDCPPARERAGVAASVHSGWNEFLADGRIELVLLATPPALHAELAIQALAAGKHVVVETPLGLNTAEADAVIAAGLRAGRSVSVAHTRRWDDDYRTAGAALAGGELGRPLAIKFVNWHYNPPSLRASVGSRDSAPATGGDDGLSPVHWRCHAASGGGVLWEFGVHCFDQLLQLAGSSPHAVYARLFPAATAPADDGFLAVVSFPGNLTAHVEVHRAAPAPLSTGWTIVGDRGSYAGFTQYTPTPDGEVVDLPLSPQSSPADEFYGQLARHLRLGDPNPVSATQARRVIALIEAVRQSAHCGQSVALEG
ncbi:MAG: Gfo/Idh/MocA family protein [Deltaproteobacteria bacterium]